MRVHCRVALILAIVLSAVAASFGGGYTPSTAIVPQSGVATPHESDTKTEFIELERATVAQSGRLTVHESAAIKQGHGVPATVALGPQPQPPAPREKSQAPEDDTSREKTRAFLIMIEDEYGRLYRRHV